VKILLGQQVEIKYQVFQKITYKHFISRTGDCAMDCAVFELRSRVTLLVEYVACVLNLTSKRYILVTTLAACTDILERLETNFWGGVRKVIHYYGF
jgi:hypothetical protein